MSTAARSRARIDWRAAIGILLSMVFLFFALRGVSFRAILAGMASANLLLFAAAIVAAVFPMWVRTWRWRSIIVPVYPGTRFRPRFAAVNIGFMGNNIFPARAGEFVRAYVLSRLEPVPVVTSLGSLVVERVFDGMTLVGLTFVALAMPSLPHSGAGDELHKVASLMALIFAAVGLVFVALVIWPRQVVKIIERLASRFLPGSYCRPIVDALESLLAALGAIRRPLLLARLVGWSLVLWLLGALSYWLALAAFHIKVPFLAALFLQSLISFAVALPSSPGFFGIYEAAARAGLVNIWSVPVNDALSCAISFHIGGWLGVNLLGFYYVWRLGLSWKEVGKGEEAVEETVEQQIPEAAAIVHAPPTLRANRGGLLDRRQPANPRDPALRGRGVGELDEGQDAPGAPPGGARIDERGAPPTGSPGSPGHEG